LLLEFGIISSINVSKKTPSLYIYSEGIVLFRELIGFVSESKNERLRNFNISRNTRARVPIHREKFQCNTSIGQNARYTGYVSRATASDLGMHDELTYHYVRITKIERMRGPSYCLTVPKTGSFLQNRFDGSNSQGSQWPCVILAISSSHFLMRDRNLLYTGASRAAESLTIFGDTAGINQFARTMQSAARQTFGGFIVHGWKPQPAALAAPIAPDAADATSAPVVDSAD
jgi:hypothetical protein